MKVGKNHLYLTLVTVTIGFLASNSIELTKLKILERQGEQQLQQETILNERIVKEKEINRNLEVQLLAIQSQISKIEEEVAKHQSEAAEVLSELEKTRMMAGIVPVEGPGIVITMQDNPNASTSGDVSKYIVHDQDIRLIVNELKAAGAEGISINDQRLVSHSAIRCVGPTVIVNGVQSAAPFEIKVIGNPTTLESALNLPGGVIDLLKDFVQIKIEKKELVQLPAYVGDVMMEVVHPS